MLPEASSKNFPEALKRKREEKGMNRSQLARAAGIHPVMPRRYEEPNCGEFTKPTYNTWLAINAALGLGADTEDSGPKTSLTTASIEEIIIELKKRNISVTLSFPGNP